MLCRCTLCLHTRWLASCVYLPEKSIMHRTVYVYLCIHIRIVRAYMMYLYTCSLAVQAPCCEATCSRHTSCPWQVGDNPPLHINALAPDYNDSNGKARKRGEDRTCTYTFIHVWRTSGSCLRMCLSSNVFSRLEMPRAGPQGENTSAMAMICIGLAHVGGSLRWKARHATINSNSMDLKRVPARKLH